ncbi:MAG: hypothetical protein MUC42_11030 [Bryobacter sp.]|nr:hypothetical protein [Bryobacter sp.]
MSWTERELRDDLRELAAADDGRGASGRVEAAVLAAYRRERGAAVWRRRWPLAIAASLLIAFGWWMGRTASAPTLARQEPQFIALPQAASLPPVDTVAVMRVEVPRATLASYGVPVAQENSGDRVQIDLLLGEDGLARAFRPVRLGENSISKRKVQ